MTRKNIQFKVVHQASFPETHKERTVNSPITKAEGTSILIFPMSMHIGAPAQPVVEVGDKVKVGTMIGEGQGFVSAHVHSSVSGEVVSIEDRNINGKMVPSIIIKNDFKYNEEPPFAQAGDTNDPATIRSLIRKAGIAGMGGAVFPTDVKVTPGDEAKIDTIILNGAECEPYATSDHRMMVEYADEIIEGLQVIDALFDVDNVYIGLEDDSMEAAKALEKAAKGYEKVQVKVVPSKYPQGSEKQLIELTTGRQVPSGGLPAEVGCLVSNVGTFRQVYHAVRRGKPMVERVTTISGTPIQAPKNLLVRIGTQIDDLIGQVGGFSEPPRKVINGGPMMGQAIQDGATPIMKGTTHVSFMTAEEVDEQERVDCIRCAECLNVCPVSLQPILISNAYERGDIERAAELGAMDCIECGNCSFICPSKIPLLANIRKAKAAIHSQGV